MINFFIHFPGRVVVVVYFYLMPFSWLFLAFQYKENYNYKYKKYYKYNKYNKTRKKNSYKQFTLFSRKKKCKSLYKFTLLISSENFPYSFLFFITIYDSTKLMGFIYKMQ